MGENLEVEGRRSVRTPMQWTAGASGGFSSADPGQLRRPLPDGDWSPAHVNVQEQRGVDGSLLNWFEQVIRRRRETPEIGWGDWTVIDDPAPGVIVLRHDWDGRTVLTLHNLSSEAVEVVVELPDPDWTLARDLLGEDHVEPTGDGELEVDLDGHGHRWFRLEHGGDVPTSVVDSST